MATCYSYMRYSSLAQADKDSIRRQTNLLNDWLGRHPEHVLDTTLTDKAVSGFRGKNASKGALADFLKAIEKGKIRHGSILVVESVDRLGRQDVDTMYQLVRKILVSGVKLVTLKPERELQKANLSDLVSIMEILVYASRAREESERKSDRAISAWEKRRQEAVEHGKPVGRYCPSWLDLTDGKFKVVAEKAAVVKRMFRMVVKGLGVTAIAKQLNKEGVPVIGTKKNCVSWERSSVRKTLHSRSVLGEYAPHTRRGGARTATGEVVENYYPKIVSEELFHKVQGILTRRKVGGTYSTRKANNLFAGLLVAPNGSRWTYQDKSSRRRRMPPRLVCRSDTQGVTNYGTIRYDRFAENILFSIIHVMPKDGQDDTADRIEATRGEIEVVSQRLAKIRKRLETTDDDLDTFVQAVRSLEKRQKDLKKELERQQGERALLSAGGPERVRAAVESGGRESLRQAIMDTVEKIVVTAEREGRSVYFRAEIMLKDGQRIKASNNTELDRLLYPRSKKGGDVRDVLTALFGRR